MAQLSSGKIAVIFVTHDFEDSACFVKGDTYQILLRKPSSPGISVGLALDYEGIYFGW
ncbi:hypothetical protein OQA88_1066, partial [Cercophora sp. LCS_1]